MAKKETATNSGKLQSASLYSWNFDECQKEQVLRWGAKLRIDYHFNGNEATGRKNGFDELTCFNMENLFIHCP